MSGTDALVDVKVGDLILKRQADSLVDVLVRENRAKFAVELAKIDESDLDPEVYEGGLKIWECSYDLAEHVWEEIDCKGKQVLELGCGGAIPSIVAAKKGADHIVCQDYNQSVIDLVTRRNLELNEIDESVYRVFAGSWDLWSKTNSQKFDVVLTSETIYEASSYESLHNALDGSLAADGLVILAAKMIYFGKTGDYFKFLDFVESKNVFKVVLQRQIEATVKRVIVHLKRISL